MVDARWSERTTSETEGLGRASILGQMVRERRIARALGVRASMTGDTLWQLDPRMMERKQAVGGGGSFGAGGSFSARERSEANFEMNRQRAQLQAQRRWQKARDQAREVGRQAREKREAEAAAAAAHEAEALAAAAKKQATREATREAKLQEALEREAAVRAETECFHKGPGRTSSLLHARAKRRALLEAQAEVKQAAVHEAQQRKFRFPELSRLAASYGVSGDGLRSGATWLELFTYIAEQIDTSIMLVDMEVEGLPLTYTNAAASALTGYKRSEMVGRNCRFLRCDDSTGRIENGRERTAPELRMIRRSISEAKPTALRVRNYQKDGTPFLNILSMHPVYHSLTGVYCYSIGVQAEYDPNASAEAHEAQKAKLSKLRALLPTKFISEAAAANFELAAPVDATTVTKLTRRKFDAAADAEAQLALVQLAYALDGHAGLSHLLRHSAAGRQAFERWLAKRPEADARLGALRRMLEAVASTGEADPTALSALMAKDAFPRFVATRARCLFEGWLAATPGAGTATAGVDAAAAAEAAEAAETAGWVVSHAAKELGLPETDETARWFHVWLSSQLALLHALPCPAALLDARRAADGTSASITPPILLVNDAYTTAFRGTTADVIGQPFTHCFSDTADPEATALLERGLRDGADCVARLLTVTAAGRPAVQLVALHSLELHANAPPESPLVAIMLYMPLAPGASAELMEFLAHRLARLLKLLPRTLPTPAEVHGLQE